jgi:thiol-disulfide isomerase/thioredoxin
MKLKQFVFAALVFPSILYAQDYYKQGSFVIKGHVRNAKERFVDFGLTTFFTSLSGSAVIKSDGSFEQKIPIQNSQSLYLQLNNELLSFRVFDKDTLNLNWDDTDFKNSFSVSGKNILRTKELQVQWKLHSKFFGAQMNLFRDLTENSKKISAEKKFERVNELFNQHVKTILDSSGFFSITLIGIITDLYFQYSQVLQKLKLVPQFRLTLNLDRSKSYPYFDLLDPSTSYTQMNEDWFWNAPEYRKFLYEYIHNYFNYSKPFTSSRSLTGAAIKPANFTLDYYYSAQANIDLLEIRDWFIAQSIVYGFEDYPFSDVEKAYKLFITTCNSSYLKDSLQKHYAAIKRLRPGSSAPGFILKNDKGQSVSLTDFKGKVVYIDFWGIGCGPCIYDIEKHIPGLHKKYKDKEVVFINICVDAKESEWKEALSKYKLDGINLIAEGWTDHPVCKAYNISGIPHYVLVDKNGKISNNNAPRAYELNAASNKNQIDVLLSNYEKP